MIRFLNNRFCSICTISGVKAPLRIIRKQNVLQYKATDKYDVLTDTHGIRIKLFFHWSDYIFIDSHN